MALQRSVGNAAVLHMLQLAGHQDEQHQHGADCGHHEVPAAGTHVQRSAVHEVLAGSGRPLGTPLREEMESRLGADFSEVRIHEDSAARASAAGVGARAYTSGNHVVIGDGGGDKHTLAHELTHVIQQRHGAVSGTDNGSGLSISDPGDRFEREAEANARRAMSGPAPEVQRAVLDQAPAGAGRARSSGTAVQRAGTGGHAQGDHVFNALDATAAQIADALAARAEAFRKGPELDDLTKKAIAKNANLRTAFSAKLGALTTAVTALRASAVHAGNLGHPNDSSVAHYAFIATLAEDSVTGPDANASTFGEFSRELKGQAAAAGSAGWELGDLAVTAPGWGTLLEAKIFDPDAVTKIRNSRLGGGQAGAFNTWLTNTKDAYGILYFRLITAMRALDTFIRWTTSTQNNIYKIEDAGRTDWARADADTYVPLAPEPQ
ncbi:DUF4157 domain-containing protein [Streptomyces sp. NPDC048211]|uniref:eCIS core domain-containing protein n=1 Tax=Streptomyces sp. NPDC048211 TaxID=3365516 RepID=UPI00371E04FC